MREPLQIEPDFPQDDSIDIHLWDYVQIVLQRLPVAIAVFITVVVLVVLYTWTRTPLYKASARILVERAQVDLTDVKDAYDPSMVSGSSREFLQTQISLISSRSVMEAVLENAGLLSDPSFSGKKDPVKALAGQLSVTPVRNTFLVDVEIQREDPRQAARIVNATVDAFLSENRRRRMGISDEGLQELQKKASALRERLDSATRTLQEFMVENKMVSFEKAQNIIVERLRDLSHELNQTEPKRMRLQAKVDAAEDAIRNGQPVDALPDVMGSPVVRSLKLDLTKLELEYSQLLQRMGSNHPSLQAISTQIEAIQMRIAAEAKTLIASMKAEYEQAKNEETLLRAAINKQEEEIFKFNKLAADYDLLNQSKMSIDRIYQTIITRIDEIDLNRMGGQGENVFVISRATVPSEKSWPSKRKNVLIAFVLGAGLAVGLCFFLDYMDTTVKGEADVRRLFGTTVLAGIPNVAREIGEGRQPDLFALAQPRSHFAEAFRSLRTGLAFSPGGMDVKSIVVSSTFPEEGKSIVSVNMAIAQAQANRKVLLVDSDMRKPRLHKVFDLPSEKGLSTLLSRKDDANIEDMIAATKVPNLSFLPCGEIPSNPAELLDSDRFGKIIKKLESMFDMVVFDSPPGFSLVDSLVTGKRTNGLVLVVRTFVTPKYAAQQVVNRLAETGVNLLGVVLNNIDLPRGGYYLGSYYGRYGGYYRTYEAGGEEKSSNGSVLRSMLTSVGHKIRGKR